MYMLMLLSQIILPTPSALGRVDFVFVFVFVFPSYVHRPFESALDFRIPALRPGSGDATESRPEPMSVSVCTEVVLPALDFPDCS